jgi:hypothetical protein
MMRKVIAALIVSFLLIDPAGLFAAEVHSSSRTYLRFRETASGDNLVPLFQYLDFNAENLQDKHISFYAGGWGRVDLGDDSYPGEAEGDLQYAYLNYRGPTGNSQVNLGRFYVFEGVASEQVDGISLKTDIQGGIGLSVYGGLPVETDFDNRGSDYVVGGRVSYENIGDSGALFRIGFSALKEDNDSNDFREEQGVDVWIRPAVWVEVQGRSSYNSISSGWMEHAYYLTLRPSEKLRVSGEATLTDYEHYFQSPTLSVFTALFQDPNESVQAFGGAVDYTFSSRVAAGFDLKSFSYDIRGSATYFGGRLTCTGPKMLGGGLSVHRMDGESDRLSYDQYRIYAYKKYGKIDVTVDFFDIKYDEKISGEDNALSVSLAGGYDISDKVRLGADFEYAQNPFFDEDLRVLIKFLYQFGSIPWGA